MTEDMTKEIPPLQVRDGEVTPDAVTQMAAWLHPLS